jgi:hypothetical protein
MSTITVSFTDHEKDQILVKARESGLSPEELIQISVRSALHSEPEDFETIKAYLLDKYENVYRSLA